ncbi:DUF2922 domain-containing protein [Lactobacillus sp. ESL0684]|uniref:DUF2922 domain-containing protein n=1 Tax=unclassified Lactobacillus TaxID=2620435 RepID=UPI0023F7B50A|nr:MULTISPECIES: DUF2922 domain-containing protein [unclassified Lactobacillus]WEV40085.1 DUF2922 domain-containing protein [Lactobacillus sp. ESL0681]WEV43375.1 DUF2922 domain-containing protein [Lactobacillus sp. ESL0684]
MTTTSKTLQLVFLNSNNKKVNLSLPNAASNLAPEAVRAAMNKIAEADAFQKNGVDLYQHPQSAAYIERTVNSVFDNAETAPEQPADFVQLG